MIDTLDCDAIDAAYKNHYDLLDDLSLCEEEVWAQFASSALIESGNDFK